MNRLAASPTPRLEPLKWSPRYETGVPALDAQHQRLFEIVEEVGARARGVDGRQGDAFEAIFDRLADYAQFHFDFEEELQAEAGLPEAERRAHAETHRAFIREMQSLWVRRADFEHAGEALYRFLAVWLIDHVLGDDLDSAGALRRAAMPTPPADDAA